MVMVLLAHEEVASTSGQGGTSQAEAAARTLPRTSERVVSLIEQARLATVRSVNTVMTSTYWVVGQRIVEHEQAGAERAS
jgi:aspartyl aminopeptidase